MEPHSKSQGTRETRISLEEHSPEQKAELRAGNLLETLDEIPEHSGHYYPASDMSSVVDLSIPKGSTRNIPPQRQLMARSTRLDSSFRPEELYPTFTMRRERKKKTPRESTNQLICR